MLDVKGYSNNMWLYTLDLDDTSSIITHRSAEASSLYISGADFTTEESIISTDFTEDSKSSTAVVIDNDNISNATSVDGIIYFNFNIKGISY